MSSAPSQNTVYPLYFNMAIIASLPLNIIFTQLAPWNITNMNDFLEPLILKTLPQMRSSILLPEPSIAISMKIMPLSRSMPLIDNRNALTLVTLTGQPRTHPRISWKWTRAGIFVGLFFICFNPQIFVISSQETSMGNLTQATEDG